MTLKKIRQKVLKDLSDSGLSDVTIGWVIVCKKKRKISEVFTKDPNGQLFDEREIGALVGDF